MRKNSTCQTSRRRGDYAGQRRQSAGPNIAIDGVEYYVVIGDCRRKLLNVVVDDPIGAEVAHIRASGRLVWIAPAPQGFRPPRTDVENPPPGRDTRWRSCRADARCYGPAGHDRPIKACRRKRSASAQRIAPPAGGAGIRGPPSNCSNAAGAAEFAQLNSDHGAFELWPMGYNMLRVKEGFCLHLDSRSFQC
jgi:hypothetical protein